MTQALDPIRVKRAPPTKAEQTPDLIMAAINKGMDADAITKLVALVEGRERLAAERCFTEAMQAAQEEMPVVVRNAKNSQTNSAYANLEAIQQIAKPVYSRHGFALSFAEADAPLAGWKRTICDVRHVGGHSARYHLDLPLDGFGAKGNPIGQMNPVQAAISTGSYGQRVLLCRVFNLTIGDSDVDGQDLRDVLYITEEERHQLDELIAQAKIDPAKLLKWIMPETPEADRTLDLITKKQFAKIVSTYRRKVGAS